MRDDVTIVIAVRGMGLGWLQHPYNCLNIHLRAKQQVMFGQNNLIFGQAMETIFGKETLGTPTPRTKLVPYAYTTVVRSPLAGLS